MRHVGSVFYDSNYSIRRPLSSIQNFFRDLKYCLDRIRKGYCAKDLWEIDTWFLSVMPEMLEDFNRCRNSYPNLFHEQCVQNHEKELPVPREKFLISGAQDFPKLYEKIQDEANEAWGHILKKIAFLMREAWHPGFKMEDGWEYRLQCQKKALEMFQTYFNDLWD